METHIKAMLHNVTMYCSSGVETEITKFLFFPLKRKSCNTEAEYICLYSERERDMEFACRGVGGYCSLVPDITSSSVVFYYISLEQQSSITLPFIRMAARAIYMSNFTHLHLHPCFTSH